MKTNIILNIGLESTTGNPVELHHAIHEIERAGITCLASGVVRGQWEGREENTLVISGLAMESPELRPRLYSASRALSQHCIALWMNGAGELIGEETNFKFDPSLFHFHPRESKAPESDCECIQRIHREKASQADKLGEDASLPLLVNGFTKARFVKYLQETLIPDLKAAGFEATAEDFETAVEFIDG